MTPPLTDARRAATPDAKSRRIKSASLACLLVAAAGILACMLPGPAAAARQHTAPAVSAPPLSAEPGTVVRWSVPDTERCSMLRRSWPALHETCYYPIDVLQKPGLVTIIRLSRGHSEAARIQVTPAAYRTQDIDLGTLPQANPSREEMRQALREEVIVSKLWQRREGPAQFALPLGAPLHPLPEARDFGADRLFNGKPAGQPHMGADYTAVLGSEVRAVESGTVVLAVDQFFSGQAVYIDHGDGLISMYFHLSAIKVQAGDEVRKGDIVGLVGSTGRSTGAHLFFGVRWHNARINPQFLFEDPAKIPAVGQEMAAATHS
jgi:murein DD-endopeptidase MepM/ murein hydrolase activator NlpD